MKRFYGWRLWSTRALILFAIEVLALVAAPPLTFSNDQISEAPASSGGEVAPQLPAGSARPAAPVQRKQTPKQEPVINFDADVIEGKKKAPDLFLQNEVERLAPDTMVFIRKDFNEFHQQDRGSRPQFTP